MKIYVENYLGKSLTWHIMEKTIKWNIVKKDKRKKSYEPSGTNQQEQGCWFCITLKMCLTVERKKQKGQRINQILTMICKNLKHVKPSSIREFTKRIFALLQVAPSWGGRSSLTNRGGLWGWQPFWRGGGRESWLQVDSLVEEFVTDQHNRGEKT